MDNNDIGKQVAATLSGRNISESRRRIFRWLFIIVLCVLAWLFVTKRKRSTLQIEYETKDIIVGSLTVDVTATGTLEPRNQVVVGSELSGTIREISVDYNDRVIKGQLMARLDVSKLEAQVTQSKAALESASARVSQAQTTLEEVSSRLAQVEDLNKLSEGRSPSRAAMDEARASYARAKDELVNAKAAKAQVQAALDISQTDLGKAEIVAPIDGIVLSRKIEVGQTVAATFQAPVLFELAEDLSHLELHVDVDEADIGQVADGQNAGFTVAAYPNMKFPAKITQVRFAPNIIAGVVTYETLMDVENTNMLLRPGMTATADIIVKQVDDVLLIPSSALRYLPPKGPSERTGSALTSFLPKPPNMDREKEVFISENGNTVWLLRDGQPVAVQVEVGVTDGVLTEVLSGEIKSGDKVIVDDIEVRK